MYTSSVTQRASWSRLRTPARISTHAPGEVHQSGAGSSATSPAAASGSSDRRPTACGVSGLRCDAASAPPAAARRAASAAAGTPLGRARGAVAAPVVPDVVVDSCAHGDPLVLAAGGVGVLRADDRRGLPRRAGRLGATQPGVGTACPGHQRAVDNLRDRSAGLPRLGGCRRSVISCLPRAAPPRPTSTGCTGWSATGSCWPTSRSPTSCSGCRPTDDTSSPSPTPARRARRRCSTATSSASASSRNGASRSPRPTRPSRSSTPRRPTGSRRRRPACAPSRSSGGSASTRPRPPTQPVAVITRHTNLSEARTPSRQELTFNDCANDLFNMIATGDFPDLGAPTGPRRGAPARVRRPHPARRRRHHHLRQPERALAPSTGWASPTSSRASRSPTVTTRLLTGRMTRRRVPPARRHRPCAVAHRHRGARRHRLAARHPDPQPRASASARSCSAATVSELRHQERELITKDATIREIHHRVKNNLQTVASLLRIQARRTHSEEAREALSQAMRRVAAIAVVHDTLSTGLAQIVDFDDVFDRVLLLVAEVASSHNTTVHPEVVGQLRRRCPSEYATPLALALTELVTNAVEHGLAGREGQVEIIADRSEESLTVKVRRQRLRPARGQGRLRARHADRAHAHPGRTGRHDRLAHDDGPGHRGHDRDPAALPHQGLSAPSRTRAVRRRCTEKPRTPLRVPPSARCEGSGRGLGGAPGVRARTRGGRGRRGA